MRIVFREIICGTRRRRTCRWKSSRTLAAGGASQKGLIRGNRTACGKIEASGYHEGATVTIEIT